MKYKVIGWTYYDDLEFPDVEDTIGFAERNAIIDEIRKNQYLFSGWDHQELSDCVPVLNDGKKRCFSQRGWGGIMAEAYNQNEDFDYARYTFSESINPSIKKYPKCFYIDCDLISSNVENETFKIEISKDLFEIAKTHNPLYLEDLDSLRYLDKNDTLILTHMNESITLLVTDVNRNKKEINFDKHNLINTKYKIIVSY